MQPIVSGTTTERIVRTSIMTVVIVVMCVLFLKDGYVSWPQKNLEKAIESLDPVPTREAWPTIDETITRSALEAFQAGWENQRVTRADVIGRFGEPGWESPRRDDLRYFGPGGVFRFTLVGDLAVQATFDSGQKAESELKLQKVIGFGLLGMSLVMFFQVVRVVTTKVTLGDEGLAVRSRASIAFDQMVRFESGRYRKKGYMDLIYNRDGKERSVRLDDYVHGEFRPIVEAIVAHCGFENPLPPPKDAAEQESAERPATEESAP